MKKIKSNIMSPKNRNSFKDLTQRSEIEKMLGEYFNKHTHKMVNYHKRSKEKYFSVNDIGERLVAYRQIKTR